MRKTRIKRVELTDEIMDRFFENISDKEVPDLSAETGLSYTLIYNLVKGRIHTLSAAHYRRLFGEEPPERQVLRVNGGYFRGMVRLWLFLHGEEKKSDLFRELYGRSGHRTDYRVFTGKIKTVEGKIERAMERKFREQGFTRPEIEAWIAELDRLPDEERVPYEEVRPMLEYLTDLLGVNPSKLLRQYAPRYESGGLKTVARPIYDRILEFYQRAKKAEGSDSGYALERLREEIYGARQGKTLFLKVEQDLEFLKKHAGRRPKRYLGRGTAGYKKGALKRIQTWRAAKIRRDCEKVAAENPNLMISGLPPWLRAKKIGTLSAALRNRILDYMTGPEGRALESGILKPDYRFLRSLGDKAEKNYVPLMIWRNSQNKRIMCPLERLQGSWDWVKGRSTFLWQGMATYSGRSEDMPRGGRSRRNIWKR